MQIVNLIWLEDFMKEMSITLPPILSSAIL